MLDIVSCDPVLAEQLSPFQPLETHNSTARNTTNHTFPVVDIENPILWTWFVFSSGGKITCKLTMIFIFCSEDQSQSGYEKWIQLLCCSLVADRNMLDVTLKELQPMCRVIHLFSCFLLKKSIFSEHVFNTTSYY